MNRDDSYLIGNKFALGNGPNKTSFKKGMCSWNKGLTGVLKTNKTSFIKGQKPATWKPVGTITIRTDKNGKKRNFIKIAEPKKWIEYSKYVWMQKNETIPKGYIVHHKDEDTLNDGIDNLQLLTRKDHFNRHNIGELGRKSRQLKNSKPDID